MPNHDKFIRAWNEGLRITAGTCGPWGSLRVDVKNIEELMIYDSSVLKIEEDRRDLTHEQAIYATILKKLRDMRLMAAPGARIAMDDLMQYLAKMSGGKNV